MMAKRSDPGDTKGEVVDIRERVASRPPRPSSTREPASSPDGDLKRYQQSSEKDDYRHRMFMNVLGLVASVVLVVDGVWLANTIAELRKNQDCVLSGGRNCAHLDVPSATRR